MVSLSIIFNHTRQIRDYQGCSWEKLDWSMFFVFRLIWQYLFDSSDDILIFLNLQKAITAWHAFDIHRISIRGTLPILGLTSLPVMKIHPFIFFIYLLTCLLIDWLIGFSTFIYQTGQRERQEMSGDRGEELRNDLGPEWSPGPHSHGVAH